MMPDEASHQPDDSLLEWRTAVHDVEKKLEGLSDSFEAVRVAVRRLTLIAPIPAVSLAAQTSIEAPAGDATRRDEAHRPIEETRAAVSHDPSLQAIQAAAAARGELSRAAGEAGLALSEGSWPGHATDTSSHGYEPPAASVAASPAEVAPDAALREEVRRTVQEARGEISGGAPPSEAPDDAETAARDEVRRAVQAARAELSGGPSAFRYGAGAEDQAGPDGRERVPDVASAMEQAWNKKTANELSGLPPTIVIEDESGRVELARVYETLIRLNCAGQASLINYTPHSVTVGLSPSAAIPSNDDLTAAVSAVFGRSCEVVPEGGRISVRIGEDQGKVA